MSKTVLYSTLASPPCRGVIMVIRYLKLDVEVREIDFQGGEQRTEKFMEMNPQHCVPTLDDDGFFLWESRAIATYLIESRNPRHHLYPKDPQKQALINQRLYFEMGTLYDAMGQIMYPILYGGVTTIPEDKRQKLHSVLQICEDMLEKTIFFAGDSITLADLIIVPTIASIVHMGANIDKYKRLSAWYETCKELPGAEENEQGAKILGDIIQAALGTPTTF